MVAHRMIMAFARDIGARQWKGRGVAPTRSQLPFIDEGLMFVARLIEITLPDLGFLLMCMMVFVRVRAPMPGGF